MNNKIYPEISFWRVLRLIFVLFSLYLLGDAFYRWDGFRFYASFSEFLQGAALTSILWSIFAILTAVLMWLFFKLIEWLSVRMGRALRIEHLLLYLGFLILFGAAVWMVKKYIWPDIQTTHFVKLIVFLCDALLSLLIAWIFRGKAEGWLGIIQEHITPLVWIFGAFVILSVPFVSYHTLFKGAEKKISQELTKSSKPGEARPNILLITFDALAARDMSLYGYHRETTPFISEWAKEASVFTKAEADGNFTTSATASLMTGKRVWTHRVFQLEGSRPVKSEIESLPKELKKKGYYNMALVVNPHTSVKVLGMENSFDVAPVASDFSNPLSLFGWKFGFVEVTLYKLFGDKIRLYNWIFQRDFILDKLINLVSRNFNQTEVPPEKTFGRFLELIDSNPPKPYFAWIHIFPPHDPYLPPEPYRGIFSNSSEFREFKTQEAVRQESFKYSFQARPFPEEMQPSVNVLRTYYDEFIRYCDDKFRDFLVQIKERNKLKNTVIILSADHGESFEHGYLTHGGPFLYEQVTNVPLIIKEPDQEKGQKIDERVEQIDIAATILDLANIQVPSWMEGHSLVPLIRGEELVPSPLYSMNFETNPSLGHQITTGSIAVWDGDYKFIHYLKKKESLLFDLKHDPDELKNIFADKPDIGQRLLDLIDYNLKEANDRIKGSL